MRRALLPFPATLAVAAFAVGVGPTPILAQALPPSGAGASNAINQSFQTQNQIRGLQQQQTFDTNTLRLQNQTNRMYNAPRNLGLGSGYVVPRRSARPERER